MKGVTQWILTRFPVDPGKIGAGLNEPVPNHLKRWWWCLGGTPAYLFLVQVITGILLTFYYVPDPQNAYESIVHINEAVPFGWWVRSIHKWSATFMIIAVILHAMRVYFTGSYRKPRELTWVSGALILFVTLGFGFTGYSLIYEQLSYWGITVAANLTSSVPVFGEPLARFIRGGESIGANTLTRFYVFHIGVLPTLITLLLVFHIAQVRLHGVTELEFGDEDEGAGRYFRFIPDHLLTELMIGVTLMVVLSCFAVIFPAGLMEKANPLVTPAHIKPEWYFYFTFRWLKLTGLTTAVLSLGLAMFLFVLWPFVDGIITRVTKRDLSIPLGVVAVVVILALTVWEATAH